MERRIRSVGGNARSDGGVGEGEWKVSQGGGGNDGGGSGGGGC